MRTSHVLEDFLTYLDKVPLKTNGFTKNTEENFKTWY